MKMDPWQIFGSLVLVVFAGVLTSVVLSHRQQEVPNVKPMPDEKPLAKQQLIFVTSSRCIWCDRMKRNTFANAKVAERIGRDFTYAETSGKDANQRYTVTGFPTYLILDSSGKELRRGTGYRSPDEFIAWLDADSRKSGTAEFTTLEKEP